MTHRPLRILILLVLSLVLLCACGESAGPENTSAPAQTTVPTTQAPQTEPSTTAAPQTTAVPETTTQPPQTSQAADDGSYLQAINRADQPIFDGPGYDHGYVDAVQESGVYTIVEETTDEEGNLWGRLKSGLGWVDLTDIQANNGQPHPVALTYATDALLSGEHYTCVADDSEYAVQIAIRPTETITDVAFAAMDLDEITEVLYSDTTLDRPLVVTVSFPGDLSAYAFSFTDSTGVRWYYRISINGRNGALTFTQMER